MGAPISGFANTPFATVMARVARVVGDGSDSDRAPDFLPASGEIVFTPNIKFSKLEVDNKSVIVLNEPVRCTIDPVLGYMIGPDGGLGVRLVASSGVNIEPQGLGYTVSFRGMETRIPDFSIFLEAGEVVDLAKLLPVDLQPGIVTTVSSKTVDAVEQALIRLNSLQENVSYAVKSIPDMFRWDGTTLLINGNPGPDLGRITDEKLEDINNTIDSLLQEQSDLVIASIEAQKNFNELDDKLEQAFPDDIFDVDLAIEQAKDLADEAAHDLANLQIGGRNLIVASTLDRKKYLRETGAFEVFASYATTDFIPASPNTHYVHSGDSGLGTKPSTVFYNANKQYLSGLAGSARRTFTTPPGTAFIRTSLKVADLGSIKLERGTKATDWTPAPEDVDAGIADAEAAAKTHATNEAARVKREAATDAQAKAEAAASAAQQAAEAYALAKAQGLSGQALADAKADAQSKADAARDAAITAAEAYADARKNEAINAAALTAQTKADAAKQGAIEAAATDAQAKANKAKTDAITAAATDAQAKVDVAKQAAIDAAKADLDALEVGGRNLIVDSLNFWLTTADQSARTTRTKEPGGGVVEVNSDLDWNAYAFLQTKMWDRAQFFTDVGQTYSLSVDVKADLPEGRFVELRFDTRSPGDGYGPPVVIRDTNGVWVRHSTTLTIPESSTPDSMSLVSMRSGGGPDEVGSVIQYRNWKLEKGNKATDWTPAPEDVDAGIADAKALATTADSKADTAIADASVAMTTADGKNTTSYKTVTTTPGAAPTNAVEGKNRRQFDMHRNRLSNGTIVGEWMWSGSSWVQVHMGDGILRSLDVGKLTAGTANIETAVVDKVWGQLGVFDKLDVRTDAYVSGVNLKNGAVTARTLNVVPEEGSGGLQLTSDGMMVVEADGSGSVDLRVGTDNYLSFYSDDSVNFSVSSDGALSAKDVSANNSLFYRGIELIEFLESMPRGIVYFAEQIDGTHTISQASYTSRIGHIVVERPSTPRHWRIVARAGVAATSSTTYDTSGAHWQFVSNTGQHYNEDSWKVLASVLYQTSGYYWQTETLEQVVNTDDISWNSAGTALVSWTARNAMGSSYNLGQGAIFYIEDVGPAFDRSPTYPWIRPASSTDSGSSTTPTARTGTWNMSSFQNYRAGGRLAHTSGNIVGGNLSGEWRGIMLFPYSTIASALSGATISKVEVYLQNAHTYASSGATVLIGSHNYASAPASSPVVAARTSQHFSRGQGRWVTLPKAVGDGFKGGTIKGLAVYGSSTANYATWTPSASKIRITYKK